MAPDVCENGFSGRFWNPVGHCKVELFHGGALCELCDEALMGGVCFRDDEAAGCVFVEAVDDAGAFDSTNAGELAFAVIRRALTRVPSGLPGAGWTTIPCSLWRTNRRSLSS